jgi:hypothetical protein
MGAFDPMTAQRRAEAARLRALCDRRETDILRTLRNMGVLFETDLESVLGKLSRRDFAGMDARELDLLNVIAKYGGAMLCCLMLESDSVSME